MKKNALPPGLVSNLQDVLGRRGPGSTDHSKDNVEQTEAISNSETEVSDDMDSSKPIVLVTNADGIESPGLTYLIEALVGEGLYNVVVCAPQSDKSVSGHSVTFGETVAASSIEINGAKAYELSGTPVDCVSIALSGALFSFSKPTLVVSGINRGSNCGNHMFYSGGVAGAREAFLSDVPSLSISLNWKKDESQDTDFKDAAAVCSPLINAAIRDIEQEAYPKGCFLNIEIPTSPSSNKGFKLTAQSTRRSTPNWQAVSTSRYPAGHFMSNQQGMGLQLAQLGRDASAAGAARRLSTQKQSPEIVESTGAAGKPGFNKNKKYFRMEFLDKHQDDTDEDLDYKALESGFVAVTPLSVSSRVEADVQAAASEWIASVKP